MRINKKDIDDWIFDGDERCCQFCIYCDDCAHGVRCYGGVPLYPYCSEHDNTEDYIDYEGILEFLEENMDNIFYNLNIEIKNVIFSGPATIVFWSNGDKTIVKCSEKDTYDKEKALAMAITKYVFGNKPTYVNNLFKKFIKE